MPENYVPPFRRPDAAGAPPDAAPTERSTPSSFDHHDSRHDSRERGTRGGRGDRGAHGMRRFGRGRGGRGGRGRGYQNNFFQKNRDQSQDQGPPVDDADLYQPRDIDSYFWGGERCDDTHEGKSSTFHDSKAHPDKLSYMLLFIGANPRWVNDRIVFAKSKLNLLPEYREQKEKRGEWELPKDNRVPKETTTNAVSVGAVQPNATDCNTKVIEDEKPKEDTESTSIEKGDVLTKEVDESIPSKDGEKQEVNETPTEAPKNTASSSTSSSNNRMKYTDIRTIPANEYYEDLESHSSFPTYPAIPPIDYTPSPDNTNPIAVFEGRQPVGFRSRNHFMFVGWFRIARVNILAPKSAELVRMQQQKWERRDRFGNPLPTRDRDAAAWDAALGTEWAVVKFEPLPVGEGGDAPPPPAIERLPEPESETKDVNKLLSKMRVGDGGDKDAGGEKNTDLAGSEDKVDVNLVSGEADATSTNTETEKENSAPAPQE